jgi:hypothetical protein
MRYAPHIIAAMTQVSFPARVDHAEFKTGPTADHVLIDQLRKPSLFSQFQHHTNPAADTRLRSSNTAESTVNACDD